MIGDESILDLVNRAIRSPLWRKDDRGNWTVSAIRNGDGFAVSVRLNAFDVGRLDAPFNLAAETAWSVFWRELHGVSEREFLPIRPLPPKFIERRGKEIAFSYAPHEEQVLRDGFGQLGHWQISIARSNHERWLEIMRGWGVEQGEGRIIYLEDVFILTGHTPW